MSLSVRFSIWQNLALIVHDKKARIFSDQQMKEFVFSLRTRLVFGKGRLRETGHWATELGERCLVMVGRGSARKHGYLDTVLASLRQAGLSSMVYEGVSPNPRDTEADEAGAAANAGEADFIIALGGGSVMDCAKLAAVVAAEGGRAWDFVTEARPITKALPLMAIPTVAASGSEFGAGAVISKPEIRQKIGVGSPHIQPKIALWDPLTTVTLPRKPTMDGAADILSHVLDRWFGGLGESSVADALAVALMKETVANARRLNRDLSEIHARESLALLSSLAITQLTNLGRGGGFTQHSFEHVLSGRHDEISHGSGLAALTSGWLAWMYEIYPGRGDRLDLLWGGDFRKEILAWLNEVELSVSLSELGIGEDELADFNEDLWNLYDWSLSSMTKEDTMRIWRMCLDENRGL
ncbi:MAG: iron-containing alcohol dehydrogenase [candidate division WOR-3 bacterium]